MRASVKGHYSWAIDKLRHKKGYLYKEKKIFNITFVFIFLLKKYVKSTKQKSELYKAVLYLPKEVKVSIYKNRGKCCLVNLYDMLALSKHFWTVHDET